MWIVSLNQARLKLSSWITPWRNTVAIVQPARSIFEAIKGLQLSNMFRAQGLCFSFVLFINPTVLRTWEVQKRRQSSKAVRQTLSERILVLLMFYSKKPWNSLREPHPMKFHCCVLLNSNRLLYSFNKHHHSSTLQSGILIPFPP